MATVKDIFGESDSSEDEAPVFSRLKKKSSAVVPEKDSGAPPPAEKADVVVLRDEDDEAPILPKKKRLKKRKENSKKKAKITKESEKKTVTDEGNAYDSDKDVEATEEDRAFIDNEGDDNELLAEYAKETQNFDERDGPDHEFENDKEEDTKKKKAEADNTPFGKTLAAMKKKKKKEMSQDEKDKICMGILGRMNDAFVEDNEARVRGEVALRKMHLLPTVRSIFNQRALHNTLLEFDALVVICDWLRPLADNSLPSLAIRTAMLEIMQPLPAQPEHLKKLTGSGTNVGRIAMKYSRDPRETPANRRLARKLVEAWSRPVIGRGVSFKSLETQQEQEFGLGSAIRGNAPKVDHARDDIDDQYQANATEDQRQSERLRVPQFQGFEFYVRPQPTLNTSARPSSQQRGSTKPIKYHAESAKGRISKKVKTRTKPS